jgi:hypothetical protein
MNGANKKRIFNFGGETSWRVATLKTHDNMKIHLREVGCEDGR